METYPCTTCLHFKHCLAKFGDAIRHRKECLASVSRWHPQVDGIDYEAVCTLILLQDFEASRLPFALMFNNGIHGAYTHITPPDGHYPDELSDTIVRGVRDVLLAFMMQEQPATWVWRSQRKVPTADGGKKEVSCALVEFKKDNDFCSLMFTRNGMSEPWELCEQHTPHEYAGTLKQYYRQLQMAN